MRTPFLAVILFSLLTCLYFVSCSENENADNNQEYDLSKFVEMEDNEILLRIDGNLEASYSYEVESFCAGDYLIHVYDNDNRKILQLILCPNEFTLGDSKSAMSVDVFFGDSDTIRSHTLDKVIRIYGHKLIPTQEYTVMQQKRIDSLHLQGIDSLYLDVVFHFKPNNNTAMKEIKGQLLYKGMLDIQTSWLCL